jgi:proteic killer suppression protein
MIKTFSDKRSQDIFEGRHVKRIPLDLQTKMLRRLRYINAAENIKDLLVPPSNKLEKKQGNLKDFYVIRINTQFRIIFKFVDGNAYDVELIDYH